MTNKIKPNDDVLRAADVASHEFSRVLQLILAYETLDTPFGSYDRVPLKARLEKSLGVLIAHSVKVVDRLQLDEDQISEAAESARKVIGV